RLFALRRQPCELQLPRTRLRIQPGKIGEQWNVFGDRDPQQAVRKPCFAAEKLDGDTRRRRLRHVDHAENGDAFAERCLDPVATAADVNHRRPTGLFHSLHAPPHECETQRPSRTLVGVDRCRYERNPMAVALQMPQRPEAGAVMKPDENARSGWKRIPLYDEMAIHPAVAVQPRQCGIDLVDDPCQPMPRGPGIGVTGKSLANGHQLRARGFHAEESASVREPPQYSPCERPRQRCTEERQYHALRELALPCLGARSDAPWSRNYGRLVDRVSVSHQRFHRTIPSCHRCARCTRPSSRVLPRTISARSTLSKTRMPSGSAACARIQYLPGWSGSA